MNYNLRFHPSVEKDLREITAWYENKVIRLGVEFQGIFYSLLPNFYKTFYNYFHRKIHLLQILYILLEYIYNY